MHLTRRKFVAISSSIALCGLGAHEGWSRSKRTAPAVTLEEAQIYLIRGLFGVFSTGMDQLDAQLVAQNYKHCSLWSWTDVDAISHDIISGHQAGDNAHVILIGHSLGSNAVVQIASRLAPENIDVDLAVTFDITEGLIVPTNVRRFVNFYQQNGFGVPAVEPPGFAGEFRNVNLTSEKQLDHGNIDNAPQLQAYVRDRIYDITHTHIRTVEARRKSKPT